LLKAAETMTSKRILSLAVAVTGALLLLVSCGGHDGVELGDFPVINKTEGDAPFELTAPSSKSPAPFTFSSSDPAVASIVGTTVTVGVAGTATITAQQGKLGSYYPTSKSTTLTVAKRPCAAPAVLENGVCVTPPATASYVNDGARSWMPTWFGKTWAQAEAYCKGETINGVTGWRLPTQFELTTLALSAEPKEKGWIMLDTWASDAGSAAKQHFTVNLSTRATMSFADESKAYVTCVRGA
jgi:multisubunit Na+/H+ antiporter MnhC subunit